MNSNNFRTSLTPQKAKDSISLEDKMLTIGSCFSDVIGDYLASNKFEVLANPFGTVYNPISIFNYLNEFEFISNHFTTTNDLNLHYDAHSKLNAGTQVALKSQLESQYKEFDNYLKSTDWLIITLGTGFVYTLNSTRNVVANCHKTQPKKFSKRLLTLNEITLAFDDSIEKLKKKNPKLKILLTVSPVRHTKDGIVENSTSKALLKLFCHEAAAKYDEVVYFPSYEIMMDDLRDYRFYREDMIHPSKVAEEYIWSFFQQTYFKSQTQEFIKKWDKILNAINHKPFNPQSESHQKFIRTTLKILEGFSESIDVNQERKILQSQII